MNVILLSSVAFLLAVGQFLFKQAGLAIAGRSLVDGTFKLLFLPGFYVSVSLYAIATILWIYALSRVPLTQAYPWITCAGVAVPLVGRFIFGEQVTPAFWVGIALMTIGLLLTQLGAQH